MFTIHMTWVYHNIYVQTILANIFCKVLGKIAGKRYSCYISKEPDLLPITSKTSIKYLHEY